MRQTACLVINPIIVDGYASLFNCTTAVRASDSVMVFLSKLKPVGWGLTICLWLGLLWFNYWFSFTQAHSRISREHSFLFITVINLIFMFCFDALTELGAFTRTAFFMHFYIKSSIGTQGEVG